MRRSGKVGLLLIAALGLASCSRRQQATMTWDPRPRDPCRPELFDESACENAVEKKGYHYGGIWYPMLYARPYSEYYDNHQMMLQSGARHNPAPHEVYHPAFHPPAPGTVIRGGFGPSARSYSGSSSSYSSSSRPSSSRSSSSRSSSSRSSWRGGSSSRSSFSSS